MTSNVSSQPTSGVGIVLVNWHGARDTIECLRSLLAQQCPHPWVACIVDNNSQDDSVTQITAALLAEGFAVTQQDQARHADSRIDAVWQFHRGEGLQFILVKNHDNLGFAAANNIGFVVLDQAMAPAYYWVLNNDTLVRPDALALMVRRMQSRPDMGICGSTLLYHQPAGKVQAYGGVKYSFLSGRGVHLGGGQDWQSPPPNADIEADMVYVSGASMLVSRAFLKTVGPMCEDYFLYNEELDWAWRARPHFKLGVETAAVVIHKEGASIGTETIDRPPSVLSDFYQTRNRLIFTSRYTPWCLPTVWLFTFVRALKRAKAGASLNAKVMLWTLFGRRSPDPAWFVKRAH